MSNKSICTYRKIKRDSYSTYWKSSCNHIVVCSSSIDVGFSFEDPLPNSDGKYCKYCGEFISIRKEGNSDN